MKVISDNQTDLVIYWVKSQGISIESLENEFIDHICCDIEQMMNEGKTFSKSLEIIQKELGIGVLSDIERKTIKILTINQRIMKFITRLTALVALLLFFAGTIMMFYKLEEWKSLMAGGMIVLCLGFEPLYFISQYREQEVRSQKLLHILAFLSAFLIPVSAIMILFNSPNSLQVMIAGILFLVFGFIPLLLKSYAEKASKSFFTGSILLILFLVLISIGFLGVKISKDRINSWVFINSATLESENRLEKMIISKFPGDSSLVSEVKDRSDQLVKQISDFREYLILNIDPAYVKEDLFFNGMDNYFIGKKMIINNNSTDLLLGEIEKYKRWLISLTYTNDDSLREKISKTLDWKQPGSEIQAQKNYLFRDFPIITDVAILNSLTLNIRVAEFEFLKNLSNKTSR